MRKINAKKLGVGDVVSLWSKEDAVILNGPSPMKSFRSESLDGEVFIFEVGTSDGVKFICHKDIANWDSKKTAIEISESMITRYKAQKEGCLVIGNEYG
jgi:hypothetical protein